ncbi:MAG: phosphatidylglycerophosphatase A [Nitrospirota bacterium]
MDIIFKYISTLGFIGYLPLAPGTFGSLVGLLVLFLLKPPPLLHLAILSVVIPIGIVSSHSAERLLSEKDSRHIVIDEFCGYLLSMLFLPLSIGYAAAAFFLFRILDILKPFPIRRMELIGGGKGIMADDAVAALYTNFVLQAWKLVHH